MNKWIEFFKKYVARDKYKLWDMDTKFDGILKLLKDNFKNQNITELNCEELEVVPTSRSDKDNSRYNYRYELRVDGKNITPISRGKDGSSGAVRQYLQVMDMAGIISFTNQPLRGKKMSFDFIDTTFISSNLDEVVFKTGKRILEIGFNNPRSYVRNAWISLVLSMLLIIDKDLLIDIEKTVGYKKAKHKMGETTIEILSDIKYTYETFYKGDILEYFKKYQNTLIISDYLFVASGKKQFIPDRDKLSIHIIDEVVKRRNNISEMIRTIRLYENDSDLVGVDVPLNTLDCAHIKSVSSIKQDALIESSKKTPNIERIEKLLDMINDINNVVLIPHNYHYLLDKGYLRINHKGIFVKNQVNSTIYEEFEIKDRMRIKTSLISKEMKRYISGL